MHLFEALLALYQASGSREALDGAESIGKFVAYRLLEGLPDGTARIPELYDEQWRPLPGASGGRFDIGHQFEWAFLFSAATEAGLNTIYAGVADRLLNYALANGYDVKDRGVITSISPEGKFNHQRGYWQQAEALRALIHHAAIHGRCDLWGRITELTELIHTERLDKQNGGWYNLTLSECRQQQSCRDQQPDGYHMTALHQEAIRIAALAR
jgi:cellobiose epimerase